MAVSKCCETFGRQYRENVTGDKSATRVYQAIFDTIYYDLDDVVDALSAHIPQLGDIYSASTSSLIVYEHVPKEIDQELGIYSIEVNYQQNSLDAASPTNRPWTVTYGSIKEEFVPDQTTWNTSAVFPLNNVQGVGINVPMINTAGDFFDPPVTTNRTLPTITLQKNFSNISNIGSITGVVDLLDRIGTVNDTAIDIAGYSLDIAQGKIDDINIVWSRENGQSFYNFTITIVIDPNYHAKRVLNCGYNEFVNGKLKPCTTDTGANVSVPALLDTNGIQLRGLTPTQKKAQAIYLGFGIDRLSDFSDLDLPEDESEFS